MQSNRSNSDFWVWTWHETWECAKQHIFVPGGLMITAFIATTIIAEIRGESWSALLWGLLAGLGGLAIYILIVFTWKRIIAARRIREEEERFSTQKVLEYALKHSGLKERNKIETELRRAALWEKITIEVQQGGDSIWVSAPQEIFRTHAIDLIEDCIYNFNDPQAEPYGISLYFYGYEIRKLWKEKKEDNSPN